MGPPRARHVAVVRNFLVLGNTVDATKGRQMPNHWCDRAARVVSVSSPVATQLPQAVGVAYASRLRGEKVAVIAYFGDGGSSTGEFHVAMNFAGVFRTPKSNMQRSRGPAERDRSVVVCGGASRGRPSRERPRPRRWGVDLDESLEDESAAQEQQHRGGDLNHQTRVSEQYLLDLEREAFLSLVGMRKTQERIAHMLKTGKPLRN